MRDRRGRRDGKEVKAGGRKREEKQTGEGKVVKVEERKGRD